MVVTTKDFPQLKMTSPEFKVKIFNCTTFCESLYHACKFPHRPELQREIMECESVGEAKVIVAQNNLDRRSDWGKIKNKVLLWVNRLKLAQNFYEYGAYLLSTGNEPIYHYARSSLGVNKELKGRNVLGKILFKLRSQYQDYDNTHLKSVAPPKTDNFNMFGELIPFFQLRETISVDSKKADKFGHFEPVSFDFFDAFKDSELPDDILLVNDMTVEEVKQMFHLIREKGECAIDTETMGFPQDAALCFLTGFVRLIQIGTDKAMLIVDLGDRFSDRESVLAEPAVSTFMEELRKLAKDDTVEKYFHNAIFDLAYLQWHYDIRFTRVRDSMIISQMLYAGLKAVRHSLGDACKRELGVELDKTMQLSDFSLPLSAEQIVYACDDVKYTYLLVKKLKRKSESEFNRNLLQSIVTECNFTPVLCEIMLNGYYTEKHEIDSAVAKHEEVLDILSIKVNEAIGVEPSSSPQVLRPILTELIGQDDLDEVDDAGEPLEELPSTSSTKLQKYAKDNEIIALLLTWRQVKTRLDYLLNVQKTIIDDRVRGRYTQLMKSGYGRTQCGAWKSVGIGSNLQNSSKAVKNKLLDPFNLPHVRELIKAPFRHKFIISDFSACHARVCCEVTKDKFLTEVYLNDLDSHSVVAAVVAELDGKDPKVWSGENIGKWRKGGYEESDQAIAYRNLSKNCFYGYINGVGAFTFMMTCHKQGVFIDIDTAKKVVDATKEKYKDITTYQRNKTKQVSKHSAFKAKGSDNPMCVAFGLSGRRLYLPRWHNTIEYKCKYTGQMKSFETDSVKPSELLAFIWCSSESDFLKSAAIKSQQELYKKPHLGAILTGFCHDELNAECKDVYSWEVAEILKRHMDESMGEYVKTIPVSDSDNSYKSIAKLVCKSAADK